MSDQVKVDDIEVFRLFRIALIKFAGAAEQALSNADSQIARARFWLESEQPTYWQGQLRKRADNLTKARDAVRQKKMYTDFSGQTRSAADEQKALAKCVAAVEEAEHKIDAIRKWLPKLQREADLFRGGVGRLSETVNTEIPKALALLDRMALALERYVQVDATGADPSESSGEPFDASMSRGGAATAEDPYTPPQEQPAGADAEQTPQADAAQGEANHVIGGQ